MEEPVDSTERQFAATVRDVTGYACPVCLFPDLDARYEPRSYSICPSCGTEYGYEDVEDVVIRTRCREKWFLSAHAWWAHGLEGHNEPAWWPALRLALWGPPQAVAAVDPHAGTSSE